MAKSGFTYRPGSIERVLETDPRAATYMAAKCEEVVEVAKAIFLKAQRSDNEGRTSEYTPPKYINSFRTERLRRVRGLAWIIRNTDPGATLVEYGAHAGGTTFVLRYKPMTRAMEIVGGVE